MPISKTNKKHIQDVIEKTIQSKLENYAPESSNMPFHFRLLGRDRMALFSFIHSLNTTFGTTIFEPVALELAKESFIRRKRGAIVGMQVSIQAQNVIQRIMNELSTASRKPNKKEEIEEIRKVCRKGEIVNVKPTRVDVWLENEDEIYMFDLKTAKPNIGDFKGYKRMLLDWVAVYLYQYPDKVIHTGLAIPYNPYEPEPYQRWTMQGMFDRGEILVAEQWWDFLGGSNTYEELLDCFEAAGISLRNKIDAYFNRFNNSN